MHNIDFQSNFYAKTLLHLKQVSTKVSIKMRLNFCLYYQYKCSTLPHKRKHSTSKTNKLVYTIKCFVTENHFQALWFCLCLPSTFIFKLYKFYRLLVWIIRQMVTSQWWYPPFKQYIITSQMTSLHWCNMLNSHLQNLFTKPTLLHLKMTISLSSLHLFKLTCTE